MGSGIGGNLNQSINRKETSLKNKGGAPYEDLYIYILNGVVGEEDEHLLGRDFIGNWVEDKSSFLFFKGPADSEVEGILIACPQLELIEAHQMPYAQWQGGGLEPLEVGDFLVVPPWKKHALMEMETGLPILLDPGVVFGNGLHPTTKDCLKAVSSARRIKPFARVLDLGTGTGVLALAAALMGARHVLAVDINPLCAKTALKNVALNGLDGIIRVVRGPAEDFSQQPADLAIANMHYEVIDRLLNGDGLCRIERLIVSGLLRSQYRDVRQRLQRAGYETVREWDHNMTWFTALFVLTSPKGVE